VESFAVLQVTGSAAKLGLVLACQGATALLFTLAGGVAGDRLRRGRILVVTSLARMAAAAALAVTLATGTVSFGVLLAAAAGYGVADGFFGPASAALLPDVVSRDQLAAANAVLGGSSGAALVVAPAAAGLVVAGLGVASGFGVQAAMLAVTAACLASARLPAGRQVAPDGRNPLRALADGLREFARIRWLWLLTLQWTFFSLLVLAPVAVLGPAVARKYLGGAAVWGLISGCLALGSVLGQAAAGRLRPSRPALVAARLVPVMSVEALALGLGAPAGVVAAAAAVTGLAIGYMVVVFQATMQACVPAEVLARVSAADLLGSELAQPVGYALAGSVAAAAGLHAVLAVGAIAGVVTTGAFTFARALRTSPQRGKAQAQDGFSPGPAP
jgi:MFS family permease